MSFSVDQFMQVKCKLQLTSESESSESIHTNCEQVRLCATAELDKNSTLMVLVCSNETSNNHILAYYIERRPSARRPTQAAVANNGDQPLLDTQETSVNKVAESLTFATLARQDSQNGTASQSGQASRASQGRPRPKIIVKQIYYHNYNEDIVALCLSETANKLILISASSTIYILPIKNILLDLHSQQVRSSQGRSMYFYDATILNNLRSIDEPVSMVCWGPPNDEVVGGGGSKSYVIVACRDGNRLVFIDVDEKKELCSTSISEPIRCIEIIRDRFSCHLLITCHSCNQYRTTLETLIKQDQQQQAGAAATRPQTVVNLARNTPRGARHLGYIDDETILTERDFTSSWSAKPLPIKLNSAGSGSGIIATSAINKVWLAPASRFGSHASLSAATGLAELRDRPLSMLFGLQPNLVGVIDVLGANQHSSSSLSKSRPTVSGMAGQQQYGGAGLEPRSLRFYSNKHYFYRSKRLKAQTSCKLSNLHPDELITHLVLTERFIALATNRDRCMINSRNCCKSTATVPPIELDPLVKEVTFNNEEKILTLIKSPVTHDQDNILDSFILVTTRSIYTIDARHNCRDLFINLIDSHLAIKRTLFTPRTRLSSSSSCNNSTTTMRDCVASTGHQLVILNDHQRGSSRSAESNLLISDFLQHREIYERICHDSLAFSTLFKLEIPSLYEAYGDRLMQRHQFELANRFFQMASFDHPKILGKYVRIGAYNETIEYVKSLLSDEHDFRRVLGENERLEMAEIAFECLLSKLIVERSKLLVYKTKLKPNSVSRLLDVARHKESSLAPQNPSSHNHRHANGTLLLTSNNIFRLCEHSPRGQDAKLSSTTIIGDLMFHEDEEETLTSNTDNDSSSARRRVGPKRNHLKQTPATRCRLECEKALIDFIKNLMPSCLYDYAIDRLLDFDLIELVVPVAQTDAQISALLKALIRNREDERQLFRAGKLDLLTERLDRLNKLNLVKINTSKVEFIEFLTSLRVTKVLVKDISLTCDFYGYQHTLVQFRKYSFAALRHLETYNSLIGMRRASGVVDLDDDLADGPHSMPIIGSSSHGGGDHDDDNANDGSSFAQPPVTPAQAETTTTAATATSPAHKFTDEQKRTAEEIFIQFLTACLDESSEDCCRLWLNYINFYLDHMGDLKTLEADILKLLETSGDCRLAISLYRAIYREETARIKRNGSKNTNGLLKPIADKRPLLDSGSRSLSAKSLNSNPSFLKANLTGHGPPEAAAAMCQSAGHNLTDLFANEFLMQLLAKTLDLLPAQSADLDALTIATMC